MFVMFASPGPLTTQPIIDTVSGFSKSSIEYSNIFTKSCLMLGLGEKKNEIMQVMDDLRAAKVDFLTLGQYLQPTKKHAPVAKYITPDEFNSYKIIAESKGFLMVSSSPLTRSSHHAEEDFKILKQNRIKKIS